MYHIDIMTLFPDTVGDVLSESILGRAQERDYIRILTHQIRDYTKNKQKQVDDYPYGGGQGAILQADPLYQCWDHICQERQCRPHTIYLSPCGKTFTQEDARRLAREYDHLILVCGHYEGIDQRFIDGYVDEEISQGDFVLTGGEIAAMAVADAVCRLIPGVLSHDACFEDESHWNGMLEYPQYSRPAQWHGMEVPKVLTCGDHKKVERWRRKQSILRTRDRRPDLYAQLDLSSKEDQKLLAEIRAEELLRPLPHPVYTVPATPELWASISWPHTDSMPPHSYLLCHGPEPAACFSLEPLEAEEDLGIQDGKWSASERSVLLTLHGQDPALIHTDLVEKLLDRAEELARQASSPWLRMAVSKKDKELLAHMKAVNFQYRGNLEYQGARRVAYELRLK